MDKESKEEKVYPVWIDEMNRIVSFKNEVGFQRVLFASQEEKFAFAIEKCSSGYRIQ